MWPEGFTNLEQLTLFLIEHLNYVEQRSFSFFQVAPGMTLTEIHHLLGETNYMVLEYSFHAVFPGHGFE
jgi:hypothetical protein